MRYGFKNPKSAEGPYRSQGCPAPTAAGASTNEAPRLFLRWTRRAASLLAWIVCAATRPPCGQTEALPSPTPGEDSSVSEGDATRIAREAMVREQIAARGVKKAAVLAAMRRVPRHEFMPENVRRFAYDDRPVPIGLGQTISQSTLAPRHHLQHFVDEARRSRLGLHQDVMRTKKVAKFRELFTGYVIEAFPSVDEYGQGEILLTRTMKYDGQVFMFGDPKGFPKETRSSVENMVANKLCYFDDEETPIAQYETFMKLAGPYWMSCVAENDELPILDPDHNLTYLV